MLFNLSAQWNVLINQVSVE
uniref:Uncharacterized protein n=1 Tax=Anguilla anguilla TaxID=7936 RepID=A0A0E9UWB4_ANGAN